MKLSGAGLARIVVVMLIAVFLGISAVTILVSKASPASRGGMPPAGGAPAGSAPPGSSSGAPSGALSARNGAASGAARNGANAGRGAGGAASNAITVSVKTLVPETLRQIVKLNGDVAPQSEVSVQPDTGGRVTRILFHLGQKVNKGDIIAYIDPSKPGDAYAANPVRAPVAGTITSLPITSGNRVDSNTVIAKLGSLDKLKITIYVAEKYSAYLHNNLSALVSFPATPGEQFDAVVTSVSPVVNSSNRTIATDLTLLQNDARIKEGMFASVQLVIREEQNTLVIPRAAVKDYNGGAVVYVVESGTAKRVSVNTGLSNDSETQITSGLKLGDEVIVAGNVTDGSAVKIAGT